MVYLDIDAVVTKGVNLDHESDREPSLGASMHKVPLYHHGHNYLLRAPLRLTNAPLRPEDAQEKGIK